MSQEVQGRGGGGGDPCPVKPNRLGIRSSTWNTPVHPLGGAAPQGGLRDRRPRSVSLMILRVTDILGDPQRAPPLAGSVGAEMWGTRPQNKEEGT